MPTGATKAPLGAAAGGDAHASLQDRAHIFAMPLPELRQWLVERGEKRFRAEQLAEWVYQKFAPDFEPITVFSKQFRQELASVATIYRSEVVKHQTSTDGTHKLLLRWPDGMLSETVWIPDGKRNTACLSSQVGCPVGCRFCASGIDGVERNLTAGEIVEQAVRIAGLISETSPEPAEGEKRAQLTNIVMMGSGEPLANYDNVIKAIRTINAPWGLNIGARKFTVSTVGLPKQIRQLAREDLQLNLALSLHAPIDELRQKLIPWGKVPIRDLLNACDDYFKATGREITLEYVLLRGVNDQQEHAFKLAQIARRLRANINLLRYNPVAGQPFGRPDAQAAHAFQQALRQQGANSHLRKSRGRDIAAACGQLRHQQRQSGGEPTPSGAANS